MPEMPEVETIRRSLCEKVTGRTIANVEVLLPRLIKWPAPYEFQAVVSKKTIRELRRHGKYLLFYLEDAMIMIVHLRMTGRLQYVTKDMARDKYARIIFCLDNGDALIYADTRTLGTLYVLPEEELWRISGLSQLGPEPLSPEFTLDYFSDKIKRRQGKIKTLLLDQKVIGGLGNIYVDESLAIAKILPERIAASLSQTEAASLYQAINQVIAEGIEHGGTTFRDYRDGEGKSGSHQNYLLVYGRKGQPCKTCGTPIEWKEVAGRGTHYCPYCQR
ncbi:MAG: DNA-formamidopyrimidine glycosylase [Pelosinus sp.]|nr:DNA-formamidopyrimidine glycosylase [Pelosinus sp.]